MDIEGVEEMSRLWLPESDRRAKLAKLLAMMSGASLHGARQAEAAQRHLTVLEDLGFFRPRSVAWAPLIRAEWNMHRQPPFGHGR